MARGIPLQKNAGDVPEVIDRGATGGSKGRHTTGAAPIGSEVRDRLEGRNP
jgi:hypothetical protein